MTALAKARSRKIETWKTKEFTLPATYVAYQGGIAAIQTTAGATQGKVLPGATSTTLFTIGTFAETVDATLAAKSVTVDLGREVTVEWFVNSAATDDVTAAHVGQLCYIVDDQTVMITSSGKSVAGRVWAVDSVKGVAVERLVATQTVASTSNIAASAVTAGTAYQLLRTNAGATASEWGRFVAPWAVVNATNDVSIQISQGNLRQITAAGDGKNVTLATTGAVAGDFIVVYRAALGTPKSTNIVNGGGGAGTLQAMTDNKASGGLFVFDGTNWAAALLWQAA